MKTSIVNILLPCFFFIHEMEEILMVPSWVKANSSVMYRRFPKFRYVIQKMERMTTWRFAAIAAEEFVIVSICTFISVQTGKLIVWYCCLAAFSIHLLIHFVQFLFWGKYIPAIVTSLFCFPYCVWAFSEACKYFTLYDQLLYSLVGFAFGGINLFMMHMIVDRIFIKH